VSTRCSWRWLRTSLQSKHLARQELGQRRGGASTPPSGPPRARSCQPHITAGHTTRPRTGTLHPDTSTTPANPATWRAALAWFHAGEGSRIKTEGYGRHPMRSPYIPVNQPNRALTPGGRAGQGPDTHRSRGVPFGIDIVCAGGLACLAKHARLCRCRLAKTHFVLS
jgi:hypothetical protein